MFPFCLKRPVGSPAFAAAHALEHAGLRSCIVGDAVTMVYGSDWCLGCLQIAVADDDFPSALTLLPDKQLYRATCPEEWPGGAFFYAEYWPGSVCFRVGGLAGDPLIVSRASYWHLALARDGTTELYPESPSKYRFPRFEVYLQGIYTMLRPAQERLLTNSSLDQYPHNIPAFLSPVDDFQMPLRGYG